MCGYFFAIGGHREREVKGLELASAICAAACGPFHLERYRVNGLLLSAYIVQGYCTVKSVNIVPTNHMRMVCRQY